jgi:hypothetical protein
MTSGVAISHRPANHAVCVHRDRSYRTAAPDSEWLTAAPSGRVFVRTLKYQRRSRRAYSEHGSHSPARRAPSGVRDDKPASWNARPALTSSHRPALLVMLHASLTAGRPGLLKPRRLGSGGPANVAGSVNAGSMLRCHGRGPYGPPCNQNNQTHHTKRGLWLRSRGNRTSPTSSWGPAPASPHEPGRISGRQKSLLS